MLKSLIIRFFVSLRWSSSSTAWGDGSATMSLLLIVSTISSPYLLFYSSDISHFQGKQQYFTIPKGRGEGREFCGIELLKIIGGVKFLQKSSHFVKRSFELIW